MNTSYTLSHEDVLRARLDVLKREHRDLDAEIAELQETGRGDALTLRRLKKHKLRIKDRIAAIEDELIPDILA